MAFKIKRYGWKPDQPDQRDNYLHFDHKSLVQLPPKVDLRDQMPPIFDQGELGSCTANATAGQVWHLDKTTPYEPSRLFIYYNTRVLEGTVNEDSGASIRKSIRTVVKWGFASESDWPYDISRFTKKPSLKSYQRAATEKITKYARISQIPAQIKATIAGNHTVNFGFTVYESFESDSVASSGIVQLPKLSEQVLGGHAVLIVGYDDAKGVYIVRNSWGTVWGDAGYFYMPYAYVHNPQLADDFWVINFVP